ncbi:glycine betaine ABC transporter substrate-binding protein [Paenibacillus senegalensis]|uniref:glycine betaine ABC transporter substrate-binding protein n=1 Tax=Paenibacillus senegalensis TaxID=1465766 RepID=UPI000288700D|nr:glycine betaine ABC transporter substrate-binding protein [Paenibacillus senegalensis]
MKTKGLKTAVTLALGFGLIAAGCSSNGNGGSETPGNTEEPGNGGTPAAIGEQVDYQIIGIDAGAGIMEATAAAIEQYGLSDWTLVEGSDAAMTATLGRAYENQEPIIVTGWSPHWKFAKYDLKYLEDPQGVYGGDEQIHTIVRLGLEEDKPGVYAFLDNFEWTPEDMESVMVDIFEGMDEEAAAEKWVNENEEKVNSWLEGVPEDEGQTVKLAYVAWDSEIASTNVVKHVMESRLGYTVDLLQVEAAAMWVGVANGDVDGMVAGWLPGTHQRHYEMHEGKFEDLGPNLNGTRIGLVVPKYMDITSIEDLK